MRMHPRAAVAIVLATATASTFGLGSVALAAPAAPPPLGGHGNLATLVDTRTWTSGGGNTFPGADVPFGMVQWSPDTDPEGGAGGGYSYNDTTLTGFSLTHVSGPGCGAAGDVPVLPMTGPLPSGDPNNLTTPFSHTGEVAQAGYYSVQSDQPGTITSELTATPHSSMGRFSFPATTSADFLVKLMSSQNGDFGDSAQVVGNDEVMGSDTSGDFCSETNNGGQPQQYTVYFDIVFSEPFTASQVVTNPGQSDPAAVFLTFDTTSNPVIEAKVGISYVSTADAKANWQAENPGWDFDSVKAAAQASWDSLLGRIQVSGGSATQTQEFYSLLYKDFIQPNITSDVDGEFMGSDLKVHTLAPGQHDQYGIFSGWDIYHSLSQLQAMLDPGAASDMAQSLLNYYAENGILQQWGYLNLDNYVMVGDPAQAIIADAYAFGARSFDTSEALSDMLAQATTVNDVRPGEALEQQYGYLPANGTYGCCNAHGVVATLLEYDSEDMALSFFASALGDQKDAAMLEERANNWENLFDPANGLLNPRLEDGQFVPGITPTTELSGEPYYVEGDAYEYLW
ncbi:MAG: GH92 family glycosyl hydrolase, partial [Acidimicrobiales bacterium]